MENKKAALDSQFVVGVLVLIASLAVILIFIFNFYWSTNVNRSACHESVILRASSSFKQFEFKDIIPLKCETEKYCVTNTLFSSGKCENVGTGAIKERVSNKKDFLNFVSDLIYDWHTTLGEGKVNLMPRTLTDSKFCLIPARIELDSKILEKIDLEGGVSYREIIDTLAKKKNNNGVSYLKEVYKADKPEEMYILLSEFYEEQNLKFDLNSKLNLSQENALIVMYAQTGTIKKWTGSALILAGSTIILAGLEILSFGTATGAVVIAGTALYYSLPDPDNPGLYSPPTLIPYNSDYLSKLKCTSFETLS